MIRLLLPLLCLSCLGATAAEEPAQLPPALPLRLVETGWGVAGKEDVGAVLQSAGAELASHFPGIQVPAIQVSPHGGPIVLYRRLPDGHIDMRLDTQDLLWSQYSFQFAHELCHILCRYDEDPSGHRWFEESLCELASLFVLRQMSETWQTNPPYPNWKPYAVSLKEYADERTKRSALPENETLASWYRGQAEHLKNNPADRDKNLIIATALLPLFEAEPNHWIAVHWINVATPKEPQPFPQYLRTWREHTPQLHRRFIEKIAEKFEISLPVEL